MSDKPLGLTELFCTTCDSTTELSLKQARSEGWVIGYGDVSCPRCAAQAVTAPRRAAEAFPPSVFIQDELDERGWTLTDLAARGKVRRIELESVMNGAPLNNLTAMRIGRAFGTSPELWINLEAAWRSWEKEQSK